MLSTSRKDPPWWLVRSKPDAAQDATRVFRPDSTAPPRQPAHLVDDGETLTRHLDAASIGLSHLYTVLNKASQTLAISRESARTLLAYLIAELRGVAAVDPDDETALLSALAELARSRPQTGRRLRTYLDYVYAIGLPMADAAEFVQLVDGELRGAGVNVKLLVPADSALALILGMVRA